MGQYLLFLLILLLKYVPLLGIAILVWFMWNLIASRKQLNRIEVLLREIRDDRPSASAAD